MTRPPPTHTHTHRAHTTHTHTLTRVSAGGRGGEGDRGGGGTGADDYGVVLQNHRYCSDDVTQQETTLNIISLNMMISSTHLETKSLVLVGLLQTSQFESPVTKQFEVYVHEHW